ncbi:hypothetical protein CKO_04742 [Citrobacter koseri ATCC BAA-895]|uniref:Uncharacterized protein n=1 Tax=Citrobacter koseri (strain ATCC BAA-895 / CDC 4225-83 / SGSC4696) TaxID=290338 RepID=A8AQM3_CITK8|nr:hypothetical protein CKO_04742 [Citrobacter koseri ATCC BAA-895]
MSSSLNVALTIRETHFPCNGGMMTLRSVFRRKCAKQKRHNACAKLLALQTK